MQQRMFPILGAILNLIVFGAADLMVGQYGVGVRKIFIYLACAYLFMAMLEVLSSMVQSDLAVIVIVWISSIIYTVYAAASGYRTVKQHGLLRK